MEPTIDASDTLLRTAHERFGLSYLFPYQRLVITNVLEAAVARNLVRPEARESVNTAETISAAETVNSDDAGGTTDADSYGSQIVILPTGAGKSLCFTLPAHLLSKPTIVIYPLLSLIGDQMRRMAQAGLRAAELSGRVATEARRKTFTALAAGQIDTLLVNPEVLRNANVVRRLSRIGFAHGVVDEAHCVSEWGLTFRPSYLAIGRALDEIAVPIRTAFTATASPRVLETVRESLFPNGGAHLIAGNPDRENISYRVLHCADADAALPALFWPAATYVERPAIVFCSTRSSAQRSAALIRRFAPRIPARYYHAGLSTAEKQRIERWFFDSDDGVLAATCAYGMGVDKPNVRTVIHRDLPATVEAYLQESGRAGRDRSPANAVVLHEVEPAGRTARAQHPVSPLTAFLNGHVCRREALLKVLGVEEVRCTGCDVCDGSAQHLTEATAALFRLVDAFPRSAPIAVLERAVRPFPYTIRPHGNAPTPVLFDVPPPAELLRGDLYAWHAERLRTALRRLRAR